MDKYTIIHNTLGVVEKSTPREFRIIQDFSHTPGSHPALNAEIDTDLFSCVWGFFNDVMLIIASAPLGTQAATFDVDAAYRRMPIFPLDQNHIVVFWDGQLWVDHCVPFGAASSNGIFGRCGDAMAQIYSLYGMGPVLKWVDDFLFFRSPNSPGGQFTYSEEDIQALADRLGWPWKLIKTHPFANIFIYLGFEWDIEHRIVRLTQKKRDKYTVRILTWLAANKVSLEDTEKLVGTLIHISQVAPEGRPHLAGLISFVSTFNRIRKNNFLRLPPSSRARDDATWWLGLLTSSACSRPIRMPHPFHPHSCFMDASTSYGIGIVINNQVAAWKLTKGWKTPGKDIGWAEMVAVELALLAITASGVHSRTIILRSDNLGVVYAVKAGRSRSEQQNLVLMRILECADKFNIDLDISYIKSADNPADKPSQGIRPDNMSDIPWPMQLDKDLVPLFSRTM